MYAVIYSDQYGKLTWANTVDTEEDAIAIAKECELKEEETIMVVPVSYSHQNV